MPFHILPSIDLRGGKVVRLRQGDFSRQTDYDVDPVHTARSFVAAGAKYMHLIDLDGAKAGKVQQASLVRKVIESVPIEVEVGGGVRSEADIKALLSAGATRVVVGTAAMEDWDWFTRLVPGYHGKLILALDARDGVVATRGWTSSSGQRAVEVAREVSDWPLAAILYTDVAVDGMLTGPNLTRTAEIAAATKVPVIASGGVGNNEHILACQKTGAWGVIVGRAIYEGKVDLPAAFAAVAG
jgi:phosphoribosylformimino-5-aminoimidazole carboxamide ribotide isomerase